ncbi:hypothetical protein JCM10207_005431 [Rhodosporidiobolus poonsookiae]
MSRPPPFLRTQSNPTFSSSSPRPAPPPPPPTFHSALLHSLPLPHLLFDSSLRLHSLNDAARTVFGVTSGGGYGGADFPPGGADVFFCVTPAMKEGKTASDKLRNELERLADRQDERERDCLSGAGGGAEWSWGEGDRVELKSGRVPGLRWAAEVKVTRFAPPPAAGVLPPGERAASPAAGAGAAAAEDDELPSWLAESRRGMLASPGPSPSAPSATWYSILLLRPWKDRPVAINPAHEKLLTHRRSFSLDTPYAPSQPMFSSLYSPAAPSASTVPASAAAGAPPSFASFTFPPPASSPGPSAPSSPSTHAAPPFPRRKDSYSSFQDRTPTLGSSTASNPFAWSSLAQRRESLGAARRESLSGGGGGLALGGMGRRESYGGGLSGPGPSGLSGRRDSLGPLGLGAFGGAGPSGLSSPSVGAGLGAVHEAGAGDWEASRPFGGVGERGVEMQVSEDEEDEEDEEGEQDDLPGLQRPTSRLSIARRRSSTDEGAPADPTAWPITSRGPDPSPPSSVNFSTTNPFAAAAPPSSSSSSSTLRIPSAAFAAASAISPRTAAGLGASQGGAGSGGSGGSNSSGSAGSAKSLFSLHSTATTTGTSPSRRGSSAGMPVLPANLPRIPDSLKGIGISVSSAGIQISQSSPVSAPGFSAAVAAGEAPSKVASVSTSESGDELATPTTMSTVLTPTLTSLATPTSGGSALTPTPTSVAQVQAHAQAQGFQPPRTMNFANLHLPRPPLHPHPLSFSRSARSSTSAGSSPASSAGSPAGQPPLLSPRPTALPPLPYRQPPAPPDLPSLLKFATLSNLPNTGVIIADSELSQGYVNALSRELLMGVPSSDGMDATSPSKEGKDDWWNFGYWSAEDEPWTSMSASTHFSSTSTSSQPFFSPSADLRANPFDASDLTFSAIIASGEAAPTERGKGTAGSGLRIGRAAETNRYRTTVAGILARSLVSDERRRAALGKPGPGTSPSGMGASPGSFHAQSAAAFLGSSGAAGGFGAHAGGAGKSPGSQSNTSSGSNSTTSNSLPGFVAAGGVGAQGRKPYRVYDAMFSTRIIDVFEPLLEMAARRGEPPPPPDDDSDNEDDALSAGAVTQGMIVGVETDVWEAHGSGGSALRTDSFVTTPSTSGLFAGRKKRVRRRIIEITATPIFAPKADGGKQHLGGVLLLRDITDSRKRWAALGDGDKKRKKGNDRYYKNILDSLPQLVWTTTPLGSHSWFNRQWYDYTGLEPEQSLGLGWQSPFHPDDMPSCLKAWAHSLETGEPYAVEYRCRRHDGVWRWHLGRALPYRDAEGKIQGWFGSCTDFEELFHMREQLRSTLQQNAAVLAGAGCLLIAVDADERITFLEGSERESMLAEAKIDLPIEGKPFSVLEPSENFLASVRKVLAGSAHGGLAEGLSRLSRTYRCLLTPLTQTRVDGTVHTIGCIIVAHDITDLVLTQERLKQSYEERAKLQASETAATEASRLKSEWLALCSHELRTPLTHILGLSELLLAEPLSDGQKNLATQIVRSGDVLLEMIGQVLDMGKVEAGKLDLEMRPFDLNALSSDVRLYSTAAHKKGLKFIEEIDDFGALVVGDMPRLRQVITNLLSNAVKFTSNGGITLRIKKVDENENSVTVQWEVEDTGIGIRQEAVSQLFKPFHQAETSTSRQFGGTGLGLSISKNLIELMGGKILLESEFGHGTTMKAVLTLQKAEAESVEQVVPLTPNLAEEDIFSREKHTILVVDDNELNRTIIARLLTKMGFAVDSAVDGYQALDKVAENRYSLILMDQQMPGLGGLETTVKIRQNPDPVISRIKIIALTASALKGDQEKFLAVGADGYLSKPVRSAVLESTVLRALQPNPSVTRRSSAADTPTPAHEKSGFDFGAFSPSSGTPDDGETGGRRRPSHPSYGEGRV